MSDYNPLKSFMTRNVITIRARASIVQAARMIRKYEVGALMVVEKKKPIGILSERDIVKRVTALGRDPYKVKVGDVMTRRLITVGLHVRVARMLPILKRHHIRHLPVVDHEGRMEGIVSMRDLFLANERHLKRIVRERTQDLKVLNQKLRQFSNVDALTGLYNFHFFNRALDSEIARSLRYKTTFSLLYMDLDHFKSYNDTFGHLKGNELLKRITSMLRTDRTSKSDEFRLRKSDVAARVGGDEFAVILPETNRKGALACAERLREVVEKRRIRVKLKHKTVQITASFGVAEFLKDAKDRQSLMECTDQALYRAKRLGKNRVESSARLRRRR